MTAIEGHKDSLNIAFRWFSAIPTSPDEIAEMLARQQCAGQPDHPLDNPLSVQCYLETGVWPLIGDRHFAVEVDGELIEAVTPFHVVAFMTLFDLGRYPALLGIVHNGRRNA